VIWEGCVKFAVMAHFNALPGNFLERTEETTNNASSDG
jgi:hypothetical protein